MIKRLIKRILPGINLTMLFGASALMSASLPSASAAPVAVFGREAFFTLNSSDTAKLKNSGFNTAILFVVDVEANGDLNYNGDHLIVQNGVYIGDANWGARLAGLKVAPTSITRIEVCTGGAGAQSWANIKNLIATNGTGSTSILYKNFLALKNALHMDAICNDDEVAYDATSAATFNQMITTLGMKNTLCPYNNRTYWQGVFNNSAIDAIYLQCYDGGAGNDPATWNGYFGGFKVAPGDWSNDGLATVASKFAAWSPVINGGFIWQFEFISAADLASYAAIINKAVDPLAVTPGTGFSGIAAYNQRVFPASTIFTLTNASASSINWSLIITSSWLNVSSSLGTITAGAAALVTVSLNTAVATNLPQGVYAANIVFSNKTSGVTSARSFALNTAAVNWPVTVNGFNVALLASNTATVGTPTATAFDIPNNYCFYQQGLGGSTRGLPLNGVFSSLSDSGTAFQLGPYGANDALILGGTRARSGTLILRTNEAFSSLAILAASANGGGQGTLVVNFTDGSKSPVFAFNAQDWFYTVTNVAVQGMGRLKLGGNSLAVEDNGDANPNLYQTTVNLASLGLTQRVVSITFSNPAAAGGSQTTAIFALSGASLNVPLKTPAGLTAIPGTNGTVQLSWNAAAGAASYNVKQSSVGVGSFVPVGNTSAMSCTVTGLANGSTYYFVVSSVGLNGESPNSSPVSATPGSYLGWSFSDNPVAYWPLNETAGTVAFDAVHGNNGLYVGGYVLYTGGVTGAGFASPHRAVLYNGSSGYTQIPRLIGGTDFSIVFWVRTTVTGGSPNWYNGQGLVDGEVSGTTGDFGVALVGGKVGFGIGNPDITLPSVKTINNNLWHQVAVTRNAGSGAMSIYIDGTFDSGTTGPTGVRTNSPSLRIGSLQTGTGFFNGSISDVAMYSQVLTANQIATLYSAATGLFYNVTMTNKWSGANLVLSWPGNGKLLEATNLAGPWTTNLSASPVTVTPDQPQKFYRVQTQ